MKEYTIGDLKYWQDELVLWQQEELGRLIAPLLQEQITVKSLIEELLAKKLLTRAFAIVLTPVTKKIKEKNLDEIEQHLRENMTLSLQVTVLQDFFVCNRSAFDKLKEAGEKTKNLMTKIMDTGNLQ